CTTTSVTLNGSGDSNNTDADLSYAWTGPQGFTSSEAMPGVSVVGTYTLTVTDNDNGCFVTDSVEVTQDINAPTAEAGENMELTCATTSVTLNGSGNSTNEDADLSYAWTGPGEFSSDMATPSVTVEGTYTLTVTDNDNGCFATDTVEVTKDANVPTASIDGNDELNCNNTEITLDASGSVVNGTPSYSWTIDTADGTEVGTEATLQVNAAGVYFLTVTDLDNNCFATNSVEVIFTPDTESPVITVCASEVNVSSDAGVCGTSDVELGMPTATDNCDTELSLVNDAPEVFPLGQTIVTWTITDASNNSVQCEQIVNVTDSEAPVVEKMDDITVNNDAGVCGAVVDFGMIGATDNCELESIEVTEGLTSGS
ncbi:PKD domain-containing protein, partial [Christiangramia sp. ASW11-125]|uniref:PKD domain-containing protein n=1 Tax=Christiangramia sp. ASW11-125 TaxID=3400701 RepID=UPI003AAEB393